MHLSKSAMKTVRLVRCVIDEVFKSENFMGLIFVAKTSGFGQTLSISSVGDYLVWYGGSREVCKYRQLYSENVRPLH